MSQRQTRANATPKSERTWHELLQRKGNQPRRRRRESWASLRECLRADKSVDLVRELIRPVCDTLFESLLGVPLQPDEGISASQIFDLYLSLNRRKKIVAKAGAMLKTYTMAQDRLGTAPGYATAKDFGLRFPSWVRSGLDASCVKNAPGERLCDIAYPQTLPQTGVPYVERFAAADCRLGDADIKKGDRISFLP